MGAWRPSLGFLRSARRQLRALPVLHKRNPDKSDLEYRLAYLQAQSEMAYMGNRRPTRTFYKGLVRHIPTFEINLAESDPEPGAADLADTTATPPTSLTDTPPDGRQG